MPSKSPFMKRTILWSTGSALAAFKPFATIGRKDFRFDKKPTAEKYMNKEGKVKAPSSWNRHISSIVWKCYGVSFCCLLGIFDKSIDNLKYVYFGWFMLVHMNYHQLRVYTPKFASCVVRMLAHFNDPTRK